MADIFSDTKQGVYLYRFTSQYGKELTSFLVTHHRMTSAALLPDPWLEPKTQNRPGPCIRWLWAWTSWFWLFALIFDQKLKFPKGPILLSFSRRFRFWPLFLHLKLQNWTFGTFFIVVSSKAFFKASLRDLLMLIQSQVFIELPPWVWGRVLEIYIRHISPI